MSYCNPFSFLQAHAEFEAAEEGEKKTKLRLHKDLATAKRRKRSYRNESYEPYLGDSDSDFRRGARFFRNELYAHGSVQSGVTRLPRPDVRRGSYRADSDVRRASYRLRRLGGSGSPPAAAWATRPTPPQGPHRRRQHLRFVFKRLSSDV